MAASGPDFGEIARSYAYFLDHSTETAAQIAALAPLVAAIGGRGRPWRLLDFGGGDGAFLAALLADADPAATPEICILEPAPVPRARAAARLEAATGRSVAVVADLGGVPGGTFDLILANHSLYYVSDPGAVLAGLCARRAEAGVIVVALLDRGNALAAIWRAGYEAMGLPFPHCMAEAAAAALRERGLDLREERIAYRIDLPDTQAARGHVLEFLFGPSLARRYRDRLDELFALHRHAGRIVIETSYPHLVAGAAAG